MNKNDRFAALAERHRAARRPAKPTLPPPPEMVEQGQRCLAGDAAEHSQDFNVVELLEELIEREMKGPWKREVGVYHPSSVSPSTCRRALFYDRLGVTPRPQHDLASQAIFDEGHGTHHVIETRLLEHGGFVNELKIRIESLHVAGSMDGLFKNEDWVLEIKSIGESSYLSLTKPKIEHVWQVHLYMFAVDVPRAQLLYVNRNNGSKKMFRVNFSPDTWREITELLREVEGHVERNEPPDRIDVAYVCRQCKFHKHCYAEPSWTCSGN